MRTRSAFAALGMVLVGLYFGDTVGALLLMVGLIVAFGTAFDW